MNGINAPIKETPETSFTPSAMGGNRKKTTIYELGGRLSPDTESAGALISDF